MTTSQANVLRRELQNWQEEFYSSQKGIEKLFSSLSLILKEIKNDMGTSSNPPVTQAQIDSLAASLNSTATAMTALAADLNELGPGVTALETALAAAQAANNNNPTPIDLTALTAAVANVSTLAANAKTSGDAVVAELPPTTPATPPVG